MAFVTNLGLQLTNEQPNVMGKCPLLITRICNWLLTKSVTTSSYQSPNIVVSLNLGLPLVTGTDTQPNQRNVTGFCMPPITDTLSTYLSRPASQIVCQI
jgi:hypothetical protein